MSFPRYEAYKESGVKWLGEVPEHWDVGALARITDRVVVGIAEAATHAYSDEGVAILRSTNIRAGKIIGELLHIREEFADGLDSKQLRADDLVTVRTGNAGVTAVVPKALDNCQCFTLLITTLNHRGNSDFFCYYINSFSAQSYFSLEGWGTAQINISVPILKMLSVPIPPIEEQTQIARFLDRETARIDALIAEQERLIELLKEKRQAVISHAVTKGLDPTAPMKDSGVEWLGEVPEHWEVLNLKRVVVFQRGHDLPTDSRQAGEIPVVSSGGYSGTHNIACAKAPGIVTGRYGSIGEFTLVDQDYWPLNTALYSIELYNNKPRYVWYLLQSHYEHFILNSLKSAVPGVDRNDIHIVKVALAPKEEQVQIVLYLDRLSKKLEKLTTEANKNIELLQERRSALISAAVTGKIDVRDWQAPANALLAYC